MFLKMRLGAFRRRVHGVIGAGYYRLTVTMLNELIGGLPLLAHVSIEAEFG